MKSESSLLNFNHEDRIHDGLRAPSAVVYISKLMLQ